MLSLDNWTSRSIPKPSSPRFVTFPFVTKDAAFCMSAIGLLSERLIIPNDNSTWIFPERQIASILVGLFSKVPQVKSICAQFGPEEMVVWTLLDAYDRDAREQVYRKELEVCELLRLYDFDFRVSAIDLVSPQGLIGTGLREIFRRG
ncbi:MAG: hypothetical protein ACREP6_10315 [Candidatus Binataceae bacterium]